MLKLHKYSKQPIWWNADHLLFTYNRKIVKVMLLITMDAFWIIYSCLTETFFLIGGFQSESYNL